MKTLKLNQPKNSKVDKWFFSLKQTSIFRILLLIAFFGMFGIQNLHSQTFGAPLFSEDFGTVPSGQDLNTYRGDISGRGSIGSSYWLWPYTCSGSGWLSQSTPTREYSYALTLPAPEDGVTSWSFVQENASTTGDDPYTNSNVQLSETFNSINLSANAFSFTGSLGTITLNNTYHSEGSGSVLYKPSNNASTGAYGVTNAINLTGITSPVLTFSHICATEAGNDFGFVEYSTNNGTSWTAFPSSSYAGSGTLKNGVVSFDKSSYSDWNSQFTNTSSNPTNSLWKTETINIPTVSSQFRVRFRITANNSAIYYGWLLDNLTITGTGSVNVNNPSNVWCYNGTRWTKNPSACSGTSLSRWFQVGGVWKVGYYQRDWYKYSVPCGTWHSGMDDGGYALSANPAYVHGNDGAWLPGPDHTSGDVNGMMLVVNAAFVKGLFYKRTIPGLCYGSQFQFKAYYANILSSSAGCSPGIPINIRFEVWDKDPGDDESNSGVVVGGTAPNGAKLISANNTGDIAGGSSTLTWHENSLIFNMPANQDNIVVVLRNNGVGGCGNDLALDDISFSPYIPYTVDYTTTIDNYCVTGTITENAIVKTGIVPANTSFFFQWQEAPIGTTTWTNHGAPIEENSLVDITVGGLVASTVLNVSDIGSKRYRVISSQSLQNLNNSNCYVASSIFEGSSVKLPTGTITSIADVCGDNQNNPRNATFTINYLGTEFPWTYHYRVNGGTVLTQVVNSPAITSSKTISITGNTTVELVKIVTAGCSASGGLAINDIHTILYSIGIPANPNQIIGPNPACIGDVADFSVEQASGAVTYNWVVSGGWQVISGQGTPNVKLKIGSTPIQVQITTINACGTNNWTSTQFATTNSVPDAPLNITTPNGVCLPSIAIGSTDVLFECSTVASAQNYVWEWDSPVVLGTQISGTGQYLSQIILSSPNSLSTFKVRVRSQNGCGYSASKEVTFNTGRIPDAIAGANRTICLNSSTTLGAPAVSGSTYSWTSVPVGFTSTEANPTVTPLVNTTYTVVETVAATGCNKSNSVMVTINPLPAAQAGANRSVCLNSSTTLGAAAVSGSTYSWSSVPSGFTSTVANPLVTPLVTTTYTVVETITGTGCNKSNSVVATINPLPTIFNVTGGGTFCSGSAGLPLGLSGSQVGVNYQLQIGGSPTGSIIAGTGNSISFGTYSTTGTYTAKATNATSGCIANMAGNVSIAVFPNVALSFTNGVATACQGSSGNVYAVETGMLGYIWTVSSGGTITSGGGLADNSVTVTWNTVGAQNVTVAYINLNGCTSASAANYAVTVTALPTVYNVTGGGSYCSGGAGVAVGLSNSQSGVNYQLKLNGVNNGSPIPGTGAALNFGNKTGAGGYAVVATNVSTLCSANMSGSATVIINPLPTVSFTAGVASPCIGSTANLYSTQTGMSNYIWSVSSGGTITAGGGTGNNSVTVTWNTTGAKIVSVNYTNSNGCTATSATSYPLTVNPLPTAYIVTGGGTYCSGGAGVPVGLSNSQSGVNYQLQMDGTNTGSPLAGTGSAISFGNKTLAGNYTVVASNATSACTVNMTGSVNIATNPLPIAYIVTGGGTDCSGGSGVPIGLSNSQTGINYQLQLGGVNTGSPIAGTGSSLSFGSKTVAGTYTVVASNAVTGCSVPMTGNVIITLTPLPTFYDITGGGSYCTGGSGVAVGLSNSQIGVNYQLKVNGVNTGSSVAGTAGVISFGPQTATGTYTVLATIVSTGCTSVMNGSVAVSINPLPTAYNVTGGGSYCSGGSGLDIGLSDSDSGVNYQLKLGGANNGALVAGTGGSLNFGSRTSAGIYTIEATNTTTGCIGTMTGSVNITINSLPITYSVTGGGSYCSGGSGVLIGLSDSQVGVNYQLWRGVANTGTLIAGTGSSISFGAQTTAGNYTVVAVNSVTSCTSTMTGSATVSINALPTAYVVTGGGFYCSGGSGVLIGLSNSQVGVNYQLRIGLVDTGSPVAGTGSALSFGSKTVAGIYSVVATTTATSCTSTMTGTVTVGINPLPQAYIITGGGTDCSGGSGIPIGLSNSQTGVNYQLQLGGVDSGSPIAGTGSSISFGSKTVAGTYTVVATNGVSGCSLPMTGNVVITLTPLPTAFNITGGGVYCSAGSGVVVGLSNSQVGVNYQLRNNGIDTGSPVSGTSSAISFGSQTAAGTYTVLATIVSTGCTSVMNGSVAVSINPLPTAYNVIGGGSYCSGDSGLDIGLSDSNLGVNYQLKLGGANSGAVVAGTGGSLNFGSRTSAGIYTIEATNTTSGCIGTMTGSVNITINSLPITYSVTGGGSYCSGGSGVLIGLSNSQVGVNYQLWRGVANTGTLIAGTGSSISFGAQTTAGNYTVVAVNSVTSCTSTMTGSATVSINALPNAYDVTGGGFYCSGGSGVLIGLNNSQVGVNYQLRIGLVDTGSPLAGTGSAISFGSKTTAGIYSVVATNTATSCISTMTGTVNVGINPLPQAYTITGGGTDCSGGSGVEVGLSDSQIGVNYQLKVGITNVGSPISGTGSALNFGTQVVAGTYTVVATDGSTSCSSTMTGSVTITVTALPISYNVTGGGSYCNSGSGVDVGLNNSQIGVNYQLRNNGIDTGSPVSGTSSAISFGSQTAAGTYSVMATIVSTGCTLVMNGSVAVSINPLPTVYAVTGGGSSCSGGSGVPVNLSGSQVGVNYQLQIGGINTGSPVAGTGSSFSFGNITVSGVFTVVATNSSSSCTSNMSGNATVVINPQPVVSISGPTSACESSTGNTYTTQTGMSSYIWTVSAGGTITSGGGSSNNSVTVSWNTTGSQSVSVNYTNGNGCTADVSTIYPVTVNALPTVYNVAGGGSYCSGESGVAVTLSNSQSGVNYQLQLNGVNNGSSISGTGSSINFGDQTTVGVYTVVATNASTLCTSNMAENAVITVNPLPVVTFTGGTSSVCEGSTGNIYSTQSGMSNYVWNVSAGGIITAGGGASNNSVTVIWDTPGAQNVSVNYTNANGCTATSATNYPVTVNALPAMTINTPATCAPNLLTYAVSVSVSSGTVTSTSGTVTHIGNIWTVSNVITGTNIVLTLTDASSCTETLSVTAPNCSCPVISAPVGGSDKEYCAGSSIPTLTASVQPGETVDWYGTPSGGLPLAISTTSYTPTSTGVYYAEARNSITNCKSSTRTAVSLSSNPVTGTTSFTAGSTTVCQDASDETYTATAANSTSVSYSVLPAGAGTINSSNGLMNWSPSFSGTAIVTATATGLCGTTDADLLVTVNPSTGTTSFTVGSTTVCQDASDETYTATAANSTSVSYSVLPAGAGTINSSTGLMNWSPSFSGTATITATATGLCGTTDVDLLVTVNPSTGTTSFTTGSTTVCQDASDETYTAISANSTSLTYSVLPAGAGTINSSTGLMNWSPSFSGTTTITATATGLCGTTHADLLVTLNPSTGTTSFTAGSTTVCQDASDETYTATAANSTSVTYSVLPAGAGTINSSNGLMNWSPSFSGTATITATATGLCGTTQADLLVTVNPSTETTSFTAGSTTVCQDATDETYTATAANSTSVSYSILPAEAGTINSSNGLMNWSPSFSGTATITATASGLCGTTQADLLVTVNPSTGTTSFTAGSTTICQDASEETYTATAANSTSLTYSILPSGAGTINSSNGLINWSPSFSGTATITATATGLCGTTHADLLVTVNPSTGTTNFTAGSTTVCQDASDETYTATAANSTSLTYSILPAGAGIINSSNGLMNWSPSFSGTATITATATGLCGSTHADLLVTVNPSTGTNSFTAGATTVCQDASDETYTATAANSTSVTYSVLPAGAGTINSSTGLMNWSPSFSGSATITATATGLCGTTHADLLVTVNPSTGTISFIAGSTTVCQDANDETYTATAANSTSITYSVLPAGAGTINSSNGLMNWSPSFSGTATITATATGLCGTTHADLLVTVNPSTGTTSFTAGSTTICQDASDETYTATAANSTSVSYSVLPAGAGTINSSTGLMNWSPPFSGTATITATASGLCGTTQADLLVTLNPSTGITSFTAGSTTICQDASDETYTATAANSTSVSYSVLPSGAGTINSSTGLMNWSPSFSGTATITATATGLCGTTHADLLVTVNPSTGTTSFTAGATTVCQDAIDETYTATAANSTSVAYSVLPVEAGTINSSTGLMNWSPSFSGNATITATATGLCGTTQADLLVTVNPTTGTTSFTAGSTTVCQDASDETYTATAANSTSVSYSVLPAGAGSINSSTGLMNWSPSFSGSATITATATGLCGTTQADRTVIVNPSTGETIFISGAIALCQDSPNEIYTATSTNSTSISYSVSPTGAGTINSLTGEVDWSSSFSGTATIQATSFGLCGTTDALQIVTINPLPLVIAGSDRTICTGSTTKLGGIAVLGNTYSWTSFPAGFTSTLADPLVNPTETTSYTLVETNSFTGCSNSGTVTVTVDPLPIVSAPESVCAGSTVVLSPTSGGTWISSNTSVATVTDAGVVSGVSAGSASFTFTNSITGCSATTTAVIVNQEPIFTFCPSDISETTSINQCIALVNYSAVAIGSPMPTISFNLSGATTISGAGTGSGSIFNQGITTVIITATNSCGTKTCSFTVTVKDNEVPVISCPVAISKPNDLALCGAIVAISDPVATDNCSTSFVFTGVRSDAIPLTSIFPVGNTIIRWTATDEAGNISETCEQVVTVTDDQKPTITAPVAISVNSDAGLCSASGVILGTPVTADNCSVASVTNDAVEPFAIGNTTVTWTVTDASGNFETATQIVTVTDDQKPTITAPTAVFVISDAGQCSASGVILGTPLTADNCSVASVTNDALEPFAIGNTTVTWTVTDASGNVETAIQIVTVSDDQKPTITAPEAVSVNSDAGLCTASGVILGTPVTADNCSVASITNDAVEPFALGNTTVTWTVTDGSGNFETATQLVTVTDGQKPTITAPEAVIVNSDAGLCTASGVNLGTPVTADNCSVTSITNDAVEPFALGNTTIIWTVTDGSGNFETATQIVTVTDDQKPTITAPAAVSVISDAGLCTASGVILGTPVTDDNCSVASVTNDAVQPFAPGITTVTWTVTDGSGNIETATQLVTVTDVQKPTITAPATVLVNSDAGLCNASGVILGTPVTADNCSVASVSNDAVEPFAIGNTTVTWIVTDASGNFETATQLVTVSDNQKPTITAPAAVSVNTDVDLCSASGVILGTPVTGDNCSVASVTNDAVEPFSVGNTTVTWTVTDGNENIETATQLVTVTDNQSPIIFCPENITSNLDLGICGASVVISDPTASDNCTTSFTFTGIRSDGALLTDLYPVGTTSISWTTTDLAGNVSESCMQDVTITDNENPVAVCKNITVTLDASGNASITADDINNGSSDNCGIQSVSVSKTSFSCLDIGLNNVTLTVYDSSGNVSTCNSVVTVIDTNLPSISVGDIIYNENDRSVLFTVQMSSPRDCDVSFTAFTSDGSALAGGDYTSLSSTVYTIPGGSTSVAIIIPIVDDTMYELTESFNLNLSNPKNCLISDNQGICTILDNDRVPSVSIADAAAIEGNTIIFKLSLSNPTYEDITLTLALTDGTASSTDYDSRNISITIPGGTDNFNIPVATVQDIIDEKDESFTISILSVDSGTVGAITDTALGTILDDDNFPVAVDDISTTTEDTPVTLNVILNDTFGGDGSFNGKITAQNGSHGTVTVNNTGTPNDPMDDKLVYTPDPDYFGDDSFTYTICDRTPDCSTATVNITVTSVNDFPIANDDAILIEEDVNVEGESVTGNDIPSGDGDNVWTLVGDNGGSMNATVSMNADGSYNYTPNPNFNGSDSFTYQVCDKEGDCDSAVVNITVTSLNDKPVAVNDVFHHIEDLPMLGETVAGNDIPSGDGGNVWSLVGTNGGALNGTVTMYPDGNFDYYPNPNFNGTENFTYQICDVDGECETARVTIILDAVGDAPYAEDDIYSTTEDTSIVGASVVGNDVPSIDGGNSWSLFGTYGGASHGKVVMNADGTFNYTPDQDFIGTDTFIYLLCDKENDCSGAQVTITVNPANDSPIARDDINIALMDMPASGNVLTNDSDPDGDLLTIKTIPVTPPSHGTVLINSDGSYTYTPNPGYSGSDGFIYEVCDNGTPVLCSQATVTISIIELTSENNAPIAINDVYQGSVGLPVNGNVISNDIDPDGNLNMNSVTVIGLDPQNGTFTMNPNGTFLFTPNAGFIGEVSFDYRICDLGTPPLCDLATVTIEILANPEKNSTFATDDSYFGREDKPVSGNVLSNDNDPQGDIQTVYTTPVVSPKHGAVVLNSNGTFTYTPEPNYIGSDQFAYRLCDNGIPQACDQANVYLIIAPNNDAPMAEDDINTTFKDMPVSGNVLTNDSDPEGDPMTIKTNPVVPPAHGTVVINPDGTYLYTPNSGYSGTDSFVYEVCDTGIPVMCDQAKVTIKVIDLTSTNNPPVAINDAYQGSIGLAVSGNVISNDFDPDGNLNLTSVTLVSAFPAKGELLLNSDGTFTYIPEAGYLGRVSFDYRICDTGTPTLCDVATVTIDIQANPTGNSTFATDDSFFGKEDNSLTGNVLANDYDPQGDIQSVNTFVVIPPNHGSVTIDANGTFTYKPVPNYFGQDRFVYEVCDNGDPRACDQGTVYLIVAPQNDPPVAKDDIAITFKDKAVSGNILTNDNDPDGDLLIVKTSPVIAPANGSVVINPDGTYTYTSNSGFFGTDSFVYEVCDNATPAMCDQAKVTIKVIDWTAGTNNAPVAINDAYQGSIDLAVFGNVISNDFDLDGNLNLNSVKLIGSAPASGNLTLNTDGTFTYIPVVGFMGQVTFDYQICDMGTPALCDIATVTIEIMANPNGNSTFATDDSFAGFEDNPITGNLLANDNDPELNIQTVNATAVTAPVHGTVVLNANGTFTYTPAPNYNGTDRFVYEVCDNGIPRACDMATVYLIIVPGDDVPVAVDDTNTTNEEDSVTGNVSGNDIPSNDGGGIWSIVDLPEQGEVVFNPDGTYIYTPDTDFNGVDQFVYKLCDIDGDCSEATVSVTVNPVNDLPEANDDAIVYHLEGVIDTTVVENDVLSGDGDNVWSIVTPPANGSIIFNPDGTFTYTAKPNFIGTDSFIYQLCDANGDCDEARVTIQIEDVIKPNQIFTPNGDGQNDTYHIAGIEYYPGSKLTIFNRWGSVVYQKIGYLNDWDGFSNVSKVGSTALPVGTYFYVLDYGIDKHKAGYVYLER